MPSPVEQDLVGENGLHGLSASRLSPEIIAKLSDHWDEPDWLRQRRLSAGRRYELLPVPRWERGIRGWWTTDISALHLERLAPYVLGAAPGKAKKEATGQRAGLLHQRDSTIASRQLDHSLAERGVIFTDLHTAAREHPALVREHLGGLVQGGDDKFLALHEALWSGGVLVYVPAGVEITLPLQARFQLATPASAIFIHTLLIAERGSRVTYVEEYASPGLKTQGLHSGAVEVYAKDGAEVNFVTIHNWSETVFDFATKRAAVGRDARMHWVMGFFGSALTRATLDTHLRAPGAELETLGVFFGSGRQHLDLNSRTYHEAPHTNGEVLFKGVVKDAARSSLEGLIRVEKVAQQTTSYLSDHTLQLSREAKSDSIPSLEIEANDVRVSHGATVGKIDEEQLFYLMARGLNRQTAERTIVEGFLAPVLQRVPVEETRQELLGHIERKMGA